MQCWFLYELGWPANLLRNRDFPVEKDVDTAVQVHPDSALQRTLLERRQIDVRTGRSHTLEGHRPECAELPDRGLVLRELASRLSGKVRIHEIVVRFSGSQFFAESANGGLAARRGHLCLESLFDVGLDLVAFLLGE